VSIFLSFICLVPNNWYQEPFFLVCYVVAALSDLPHQKRFGFYFSSWESQFREVVGALVKSSMSFG